MEEKLSEGTRKLIALQNRLSTQQQAELLKIVQEELGGNWKDVLASFPNSQETKKGITINQPEVT